MTDRADPQGYYTILNVPQTADDKTVKAAYRARAKELHPDTNTASTAADDFKKLNDAYRVLSDPDSRAFYNTRCQAQTARLDEATGYQCCSDCGVVSAQPRHIAFSETVSWGISYRQMETRGIFCPACARKTAFRKSMRTWALGWWHPVGFIKSLQSLMINFKGGIKDEAENNRLLIKQAQAFLNEGHEALAHACATGARRFAKSLEERRQADGFLTALEGCRKRRLKPAWAAFGTTQLLQLLPILVPIFFYLTLQAAMLIDLSWKDNGATSSADVDQGIYTILPMHQNLPYLIGKESALLRHGPSRKADSVTRLSKDTPVLLTGALPNSQWVRVQAKEDRNQTGFLLFSDLKPVPSEEEADAAPNP